MSPLKTVGIVVCVLIAVALFFASNVIRNGGDGPDHKYFSGMSLVGTVLFLLAALAILTA